MADGNFMVRLDTSRLRGDNQFNSSFFPVDFYFTLMGNYKLQLIIFSSSLIDSFQDLSEDALILSSDTFKRGLNELTCKSIANLSNAIV